jgi:hypothetical protein
VHPHDSVSQFGGMGANVARNANGWQGNGGNDWNMAAHGLTQGRLDRLNEESERGGSRLILLLFPINMS